MHAPSPGMVNFRWRSRMEEVRAMPLQPDERTYGVRTRTDDGPRWFA